MLKLIIFDLDGTLVNAYDAVAVALKRILLEFDLPIASDDAIQRSVGWGERHLLGCFVPEEKLDQAVELYRQYHKEAIPGNTRFLPDADKLIKELEAKGYALAIATNRPVWSTAIILKHLQIDSKFEFVLSAEQVDKHKPEPDILFSVLGQLSFTKEEALYVGDMTVDAKTGNAADVKTVIVTTGSSTREEIARELPFAIIDNVLNVLEFV